MVEFNVEKLLKTLNKTNYGYKPTFFFLIPSKIIMTRLMRCCIDVEHKYDLWIFQREFEKKYILASIKSRIGSKTVSRQVSSHTNGTNERTHE